MPYGEGWDMPVQFEGWSDFHWWKVPANRVLVLVCLSEGPVWYSGHFLKGRMEPCQGEGCRSCREGVGAQARYIFVCLEPLARKVGLLEVSRSVALEFREIAEGRGALRGLTFEIGKHTRHKQSRMEVVGLPDYEGVDIRSFEVPDVKKALILTWEKAGFEVPKQYLAPKSEVTSVKPLNTLSRGKNGRNGESGGSSRAFKVTAEGIQRDAP